MEATNTPLTKAQLDDIYLKIQVEAKRISREMDHKNWWPCGNAYLMVKGTSPLVKAIKANPNCGLSAMKDTYHGGYWVSAKVGWTDAFECQNMNYAIKVNESLQQIVKEYGIESYVGSYID